jgi:hypothetical protein
MTLGPPSNRRSAATSLERNPIVPGAPRSRARTRFSEPFPFTALFRADIFNQSQLAVERATAFRQTLTDGLKP